MKKPGNRTVLSLAALLWIVATAAEAQPRAVLGESVFDVGTVPRGETVEQTFRIRNEGDQTLEITDVRPACGCTVVDYDAKIAPGEVGAVAASLSTKGLRGPIAKTIQVYTSDQRNPRLELVIKADVRAYVESDPGYARFLAVLGKGGEPIIQKVWTEETGEFRITKARSPHSFVKADFREATDEERVSSKSGRQWIVEISLDRNAPEGAFADFVTLEIDHPRLRQVKIPVSGFVRPVVAVLPRVADFGRKDLSKPQTQILEVRNLGDSAVTLGPIESTVAGLTSEIEVVEDGQHYRLKLTLDPSMPKGTFRGTLTIPTDNRLQPKVEIDVRGSVL